MTFDWKFFVTIFAAIAGILVPVWLWKADLSAHSLSVRIASSVALQPTETTSIPDIQITIDGVNLRTPFLSTLVLLNNGSKPIPASDFESPIELSVGKDTQIVRARISSVDPHNLKAELDTNKQSVKLSPLLLNPEDMVTIALITSGSPPNFNAQARIAGISKIKLENATTKKNNWMDVARYSVIGFLSFVLYWVYGAAFIRPTSVRLGRLLTITTMIICGLYSSSAIHRSLDAADMDFGKVEFWLVSLAIALIGLPILFYNLRRATR